MRLGTGFGPTFVVSRCITDKVPKVLFSAQDAPPPILEEQTSGEPAGRADYGDDAEYNVREGRDGAELGHQTAKDVDAQANNGENGANAGEEGGRTKIEVKGLVGLLWILKVGVSFHIFGEEDDRDGDQDKSRSGDEDGEETNEKAGQGNCSERSDVTEGSVMLAALGSGEAIGVEVVNCRGLGELVFSQREAAGPRGQQSWVGGLRDVFWHVGERQCECVGWKWRS